MEEGAYGGRRGGGNILDPTAQEFHPSSSSSSSPSHHLHHNQHFTLLTPQIYLPYPSLPQPLPLPLQLPLPLPLTIPQPPLLPLSQQEEGRFSRPSYVSHGPTEALPDAIPTRSLLLSSVSPDVTERSVRMEMELYGGVRAVDMSRLFEEGIVTVNFYDLRSSKSAMDAIRSQHVRQQSRIWNQIQQHQQQPHYHLDCGVVSRNSVGELSFGRGMVDGRAVWAQYAAENVMIGGGVLDWYNNGSLVVFNLDPSISSDDLRRVFEPFGAVKETRETPMKNKHKFVEFFDTRDAARALAALNGKELLGKKMSIQFSRPGGNGRSNYCRKSSNVHQSIQLPPRLVEEGGRSPAPPPSATTTTTATTNSNKNGDGSTSLQHRRDRKSQSSTNTRQKTPRNHPGGRNRSISESRFLIRGDTNATEVGSTSSPSSSPVCRDTRTTLMIKNIPNKYSQKLLLNMLDIHCLHCNEQIAAGGGGGSASVDGEEKAQPFSSYDFVYLPIDFNNKCNVGYGFVNMTSPEATWRLYKAFHSRPWEVFNSRKICQITYARLQGLEALMEHFRNSKFACDNDEYMPVVFIPPRDGKNCTDPTTIGCRGSSSSSSVDNVTAEPTLLRFSSTVSDDPTDGCESTHSSSHTTLECHDNDDDYGDGGVTVF